MRRIGYTSLAFAASIVLGLAASNVATALDGRDCVPPVFTPAGTGAVLDLRTFNDCPTSVLTTLNNYPALISIKDDVLDCYGWANLHTWSFSDDGVSRAIFENCSHYRYSCSFVLEGPTNSEGGLRVSPWWNTWWGGSPVDGRFMVNAASGEIACFGGRLPFYSFTGTYGLRYVKGTWIWMEIAYNPHSLTAADPATITYTLNYGGVTYTSGQLAFDQGSAGEDPPHGLWGELWPATVGGYFQVNMIPGDPTAWGRAQWANIQYWSDEQATPARATTWGRLKTLYR